jgi:two-component system LytT family sensor kinase
MNNIFISNKSSALMYIAGWIAIASLYSLVLYSSTEINLSYIAAESFIFNLIFAALAINLWYVVRFNTFETKTTLRIILNHFAGAITVSTVWIISSYMMMYIFVDLNAAEQHFLIDGTIIRFIVGLFYYLSTIIIFYLIIYYLNFKEKLTNESTLQTLMKENELKTLKYQINPHFIFNSLNSISSLILAEDKRAHEMTVKLSSFIRSTLSKNDNQFVKLCDEIKNLELYLEIEKIRFEDKFNYIKNVSENCCNVMIPNMLIQPLIENAIKHGVYESLEPVTISLTAGFVKEYLKIEIKNSFDIDAVPQKGEGIGLKNVSDRLKLIYKQDNLIQISKDSKEFTVTIYIPEELKK